jgi:AcrR family transcriptional regulator
MARRPRAGTSLHPRRRPGPLAHEFRHAVLAGLASVPRNPGPRNGTKQKPGRELLGFCRDRRSDVLLFTEDTSVWPTNNLSERGVRPLRTQQKLSGRLTSDDVTQDRLDIRSYIDAARRACASRGTRMPQVQKLADFIASLCNTCGMCPRRLDPNNRSALIDAAARLLSEEGPGALSTRRLAAETGMSTMAVYTYFGSMSALVREIVYEGFARLAKVFDVVQSTDDPVCDMAMIGRAYRQNATTNPHAFSVMFGSSSLAGFELSAEDRQHGIYTLSGVVACAERCISANRFRPADAGLVAYQMWNAVHGTVSLELGGYLIDPYGPDRCFEAQLTGLMIGAGDAPETAAASVAASGMLLATVLE